MPANLENLAIATGLQKSVLISISKKGLCKNVQTATKLHSFYMLAKIILQILQTKLQQSVNQELPDVQGGFRNKRSIANIIAQICR